MDKNGHQVSNMKEIEFQWEGPDLNMHAVIRRGIETPFAPSTNSFELGSLTEDPIMIDEVRDKEFSPPPTTPVSERPTRRLPLRC